LATWASFRRHRCFDGLAPRVNAGDDWPVADTVAARARRPRRALLLLLALPVVGALALPASALALAPTIELIRAKLRWQPESELFVAGYILDLRYRLCDPDSFGDVDVGSGPATEELVFERRTASGRLLSRRRQRSPVGIATGCLNWKTELLVPSLGRPRPETYLHLRLRVRDPEGAWSNAVTHRWRLEH